jgi:hypothetical protein
VGRYWTFTTILHHAWQIWDPEDGILLKSLAVLGRVYCLQLWESEGRYRLASSQGDREDVPTYMGPEVSTL